MSKDKPLDILGESHLPADLFTPTLGSNYGLDGFEDMHYNSGVLEGVLNPELLPGPAVPDGFEGITANEMGIAEFMKEADLADLDWLADAEQDPERLPQNPVDLAIPELEEAWGVDRRTNGIKVFSTDLSHARALEEASPLRKNERELSEILVSAMRRSAAGDDIEQIIGQSRLAAGLDSSRIEKGLDIVRSEHGLAGNVFVRAAAYPSYEKGKWKKEVLKAARNAEYILVSEQDFGSTHIQNGRCTVTGKKAVLEVPWKDALAHYGPLLGAVGRKVASDLPPRDALRAAFSAPTTQQVASGGRLPHYKAVCDTVTSEEARAALASADATPKEVHISEAGLQQRISSWKSSNMIDGDVADEILASDLPLNQKLDRAVAAVTAKATAKADFTGAPNTAAEAAQARQHLRLVRNDAGREAAEAKLEQITAFRNTEELDRRVARVIEEIEKGARGSYLKSFITRLIPQKFAAQAVHLLRPTLERTGALEDSKTATSYDGHVYERAPEVRAAIELSDIDMALVKAASDGDSTVGEIKSVLKWASRHMSEGSAGQELSELLQHRFSNRILKAASGLIQDLRGAHEGAAGFLYVDADAYMAPQGISGCETGALRHRANQIPAVLASARCQGCTRVCTLSCGTRKCGTYNKVLLEGSDLPENIQSIKKANITGADHTDAEDIASMFNSTTYDPDEFSLRNADFEEQVELAPLPENEKIGEIVLGGFLWE